MSNVKTIFVQLRDGFNYLNSSGLAESEPVRLTTLNLVSDFVFEGNYTDYKKKELFLSCENESDKVISKILKISEAGVRQVRKRVSEDAFSVLGHDVVNKILYSDIRYCKTISDNVKLLTVSSNLEDFFLPEIIERINSSYLGEGVSKFDLLNCKNELLFLSLFTLNQFSAFISNLDSEKLNYILRLISGEEKDNPDRLTAVKFMTDASHGKDIAKMLGVLSDK